MVKISSRVRSRKIPITTITDSVMAGMLACRRYGRITRTQFAAAARLSDHYTSGLITRLADRRVPILSVLGMGLGKPDLIGLTVPGNTLIEAATADARYDDSLNAKLPRIIGRDLKVDLSKPVDLSTYSRFSKPTMNLPSDHNQQHKRAVIDAMIAAERDMPSGMHLDRIRVEFRKDIEGNGYATKVDLPDGRSQKPDAVLTLRRDGCVEASMIEIDMKSEMVTSFDARRSTIQGKVFDYWKYLASGDVVRRFGATVPAFRVLFITTSRQRIQAMIAGIEWRDLAPIGGIWPHQIFHFSTHDQCQENFFGQHWTAPGASCPHSLILETCHAA
jgi:hypothetical protein